MSVFRNLLTGLLTALASILIVLGALSVSIMEGFRLPVPTVVEESTSTPVPQATLPLLATTSGMTALPTATRQPTATATATLFAPTACPTPDGWREYTVQPGDSLPELAQQNGISSARLMRANCLVSQSVLIGSVLYLPPLTVATSPVYPTVTISCGVPFGWIRYVVQPGDTLFNLSLQYSVSVLDLQYANCLQSSHIRAGETIWVPNVATRTPRYSPTAPVTATPTRTRVPPTPPPTATVPTPLRPNPASPRPNPATATGAPSSTPVPTITTAATISATPAGGDQGQSTPGANSTPSAPTAVTP